MLHKQEYNVNISTFVYYPNFCYAFLFPKESKVKVNLLKLNKTRVKLNWKLKKFMKKLTNSILKMSTS